MFNSTFTRRRLAPSSALLLAALAGSVWSASTSAGPIFNPYVPAEERQNYINYIRSIEQESAPLDTGDRFTDPPGPTPIESSCAGVGTPDQSGLGARVLWSTTDQFEGNPLDRDHEIYWSYLPDGVAIEGSPPNQLHPEIGAFVPGQTFLPVTTANMFPAPVTDDLANALFSTLNNLPSPVGFGNLGQQFAWQSIVSRAFDKWEEVSGIEFIFIGGQEIQSQPNPDSGNAWDVSASTHPPATTANSNITEGDIRIGMVSLDGTSSPNPGFNLGHILSYVYPVGIVPDIDPTDMPMAMDLTMVNCNWGYQGNILLDKEERWTDPATPDLFDIVITRSIGQAIGLLPVCAAEFDPGMGMFVPGEPFSIMEHQVIEVPLPVLFFTELQPDDVRAVQNLYGDPFESNDGFSIATEIPVNLAPGVPTFTFAPHLMIPPDSDIEIPLPLSIANNQPGPVQHQLDTNGATDIDVYRLPVPVSETGGFLLDVTVQPVGEMTTEFTFDPASPNNVALEAGDCDSIAFITPHIDRQLLSITVDQFDPFSNTFVPVDFSAAPAAGSPAEINDLLVDDGVYYITIAGDGADEIQMYNLTVEITRQVAQSGLDVMPLLDLLEVQEFDTAGFTGAGANYAVLDGLLASPDHDVFGGQPRNTVAWSGAGAATTQIGSHATNVAGLAIGDVDMGINYRGVAPDAEFFSAAVASDVFADGSFTISKTALYFALFGLSDPAMANRIGLPGTAGVINTAFSGGGRALTGDDSISQAFDAAVSMNNVTIVAAAGNNGLADPFCRGVQFMDLDPGARFLGSRSLVAPAAAQNVITVGAAGISELASPDPNFDIVTNFSSRGPADTTTFDGTGTINNDVRTGIDIVAPGTAITAIPPDFTPPGGNALPVCQYQGAVPEAFLRVPGIDPDNAANTSFFSPGQGTSLASAVVSGAVALLQDVASSEGYADHPAVMKSILLNGAEKLAGWTNNPGDAPAKPQDTRNGLDTPNINTMASTQPLDVAQGAGLLNLRRSLENFHAGYLPASEESFFFAGPPTIDPPETDPNVPTVRTPPDPNGTFALAAPESGGTSDEESIAVDSLGTAGGAGMTQDEAPLSPIEIYRRLGQVMKTDRTQWIGHSLQFGFGKPGDLKPGRGLNPPPFTTGPVVPFIIPSLGRTGSGGTGNGDFPGVPGSGANGNFPAFIDQIDVRPIGWDFGNIDQTTFLDQTGATQNTGFIDYLIEVPLLTGRPDPEDQSMFLPADQLTVTLSWLRTVTVEGIDFRSPSDPRIGAVTELGHENLDLSVFAADAFGNPIFGQPAVASSVSVWESTEHVSFAIPQDGLYVIRVSWVGSNYDLFGNLPAAEVQFGVAWRVDFSERQPVTTATNVTDIINVLDHWGGRGSNGRYALDADLTLDGEIDLDDVMQVISNWDQN